MPVQVSYPGVYIQEVSSGSRTITGVSSSVALFIGMADQGPMGTPTRVLSLTDYERKFGATNGSGELHDQVTQFFLNGGSQAWIMRIANNATSSAVTLANQDDTNVLTLTARSAGTIGESLRAIVDYNTATPEMTFNLEVQLWGTDTGGSPVVVVSEVFKNLSMDPNHGNYVVSTLAQNSALVTATDLEAPAIIDGYTVWGQMEPNADPDKNLGAAITAAGGTGRFQVSADDGPMVPVSVSAATTIAINDAIELALASQGKTVTVTALDVDGSATYYAYKISVDGGRRIRFASVNGVDDIGAAMNMTSSLGALEVCGYAIRRPAPTGYFSNLSFESVGEFQGSIGAFMASDLSAINPIEFDDAVLGAAESFSPSWTAASGTMAAPVGEEPTLRALQLNIDQLVSAINAHPSIDWVAARHGHRLVMKANFNGDQGDVTAVLNEGDAGFNAYFDDAANVTRYQLGGTGLPGYQTDAGAGDNGTKPVDADYKAAFVTAGREIDLFNILVLPRAAGQSDADRAALWPIASVFAMGRRAIVLVDAPSSWTTIQEVETNIAEFRIGIATDHAATYWPRLEVSWGAGTKKIDPSGAIAGVMARTDASRGVWKAPAGLDANLLGVRGIEHAMSDADNGIINPLAVNAIRAFPNGIVSWGARTMVGFDNSGNDEYKYVPIRRLALMIEESLYRGLKWAVFEPNDTPLWRQLAQAAGAYMNGLFQRGAFAGAKASDAYFVKVDADTTTQNDVNLGIVNVVIGFAPLKPAEFVVITLQQKAGEVQT
ncbi:Phage tail sheath protein FI [Enhygromyxa salina]|uniref:Phage tail sheath protein FI n=1 Tax=Enhygromyxa salina TaxID=215803 RepID=A0A0C1ZK86_9BACT|nr:DUF2586 family protein [Enhygromyxa salina]KIG17889.1 Phage tail sheath protein FI [Enhygromyxa salina]